MAESSDPSISRRLLLGGGLAGTSAVVLAALTGPTASGQAVPTSRPDLKNAHVDVLINVNQDLLVTGTVGGAPVRARGPFYAEVTAVTGALTEQPMAAIMTMSDQVRDGSGYLTSARLTFSVGDGAMVLTGKFRLDGQYAFTHGTISGSDRGEDVSLTVQGRDGGNGAKIRGKFAGVAVDILAQIPDDSGASTVVGTLDGRHVDLRLRQTRDKGGFPPLRLTGTYNGSPEILALIIGAVAYFGP
jgi:hypothetical protein